jgi:hypothetical protein
MRSGAHDFMLKGAVRAPDQPQSWAFMTGGVFAQNARAYLGKVEKPFPAELLQTLVRKSCSNRTKPSGRRSPSRRPRRRTRPRI